MYWRDALWRLGFESPLYRDALMEVCRNDILFWLNAFVWIFEARRTGIKKTSAKCLPFITYDFQDPVLLKLVHSIFNSDDPNKDHDIVISKSRDMGASWMCLMVFLWYWLFHDECTFLCMSAKEEMVDSGKNPKCLFYKLTYAIDRLPSWMRPEYKHTAMHLYNYATRSVIDGEATSANSTVSDRRLAILLDEFAKVDNKEMGLGAKIVRVSADATNCRIFNSTFEGQDTGFYPLTVGDEKNVLKLHWSIHPEKKQGLYRFKDGKVTVIDDQWHDMNPGYKFMQIPGLRDGLRSPFYDVEWKRRRGIERDIASELDMYARGAGDPYFPSDQLIPIRAEYERAPNHEGIIDEILSRKVEDYDDRLHRTKWWFNPKAGSRPPQNTTYTIGVDISQGSGASDSAVSVGNDQTGEKVFEFITNHMLPSKLADVVFHLCEKFTTNKGKPYLIWDAGGPGRAFSTAMVERHHYEPIFRYKNKQDRKGVRSSRPGYPGTKDSKNELFYRYRDALFTRRFITHSRMAYEQASEYVHATGGRIIHQGSRTTDLESDSGDNHGDIACSEALLVVGMQERPEPTAPEKVIPRGSFAWRFKKRREAERKMVSMFG